MCVCVFGKEQQNRTALPGYSWQIHSEEQTEVSTLRREEEGAKTPDLLLPVVLLQEHPAGPAPRGGNTQESAAAMEEEGGESCRNHHAEGLKANCFVFLLSHHGVDDWTTCVGLLRSPSESQQAPTEVRSYAITFECKLIFDF